MSDLQTIAMHPGAIAASQNLASSPACLAFAIANPENRGAC